MPDGGGGSNPFIGGREALVAAAMSAAVAGGNPLLAPSGVSFVPACLPCALVFK